MSDNIKKLALVIKNLSKTDNYSIKIIEEEFEIFGSKIREITYWPSNLAYPIKSEGKILFLLAQINFDKEKQLPTNGLLQFFTGDDSNELFFW